MSYSDYTRKLLAKYPSGMKKYRELLGAKASETPNRVLHLGCGHDLNGLTKLFHSQTEVLGLDPDVAAVSRYPGRGYVGDGGDMPFEDEYFDLVFSEMVLEHLEDPQAVFQEVKRVLRPGGGFISVTPNFWSYKSIAAAITPHGFHKTAVRLLRRDSRREDADVYPTRYRANTKTAITELADNCGLSVESISFADNGPTWFQRLPGVFEVGRFYHFMLRAESLAWLRCNIVCVLGKPGAPAA